MEKLIIIGCGPKAIAIAAKAKVLSKMGWQVPEILIIDKKGPAANWDGSGGHTDGDTILGTTPLEDVGFPYESIIDRAVDEEMLKLSYVAYLVSIGKYAEWVDRQLTPPSHAMLADYLKWVFSKVGGHLNTGEVHTISNQDGRWIVSYQGSSGEETAAGDGLVITGPGLPRRFPHIGDLQDEDRIFNGRNIWHEIGRLKDAKDAKIAVIGAGETSAGVVTGLLKVIDKTSEIDIITRHPILFTRNENWMEVMYFSKVMDWAELSDNEKKEVIRHADRGTFSVAAKDLLDSAYNVRTRLGDVHNIEAKDGRLFIHVSRDGEKQLGGYDFVVEATGFDQFSFIDLFADKSIFADIHSSPIIHPDMSLEMVGPKLHLPNLAAMAQGPGFPNLSCLGLLAERILTPYISK